MNFSLIDQAKSEITLENDKLNLKLIPDLGGKIAGLILKESGTQFLKLSDISLENIPQPEFGELFLPPYAFGFDECFPNVSPSGMPLKGSFIDLPDHGELWSRPWKYELADKNKIRLYTEGNLMSYTFSKKVQIVENTIKIEYELKNLEDVTFHYIWSAHPLLNIQQGDELILPEGVSQVLLNWSSDASLGRAGDYLSWPDLFGEVENQNFNTVASESLGFAAKLFTDKLKTGKAGIFKKETGESLIFSFDIDETPYLGIWICYGGWPVDSVEKEYTLALEPCSGRPDDLSTAIDRNESSKMGPGATKKWSMNIKLNPGKEKLN